MHITPYHVTNNLRQTSYFLYVISLLQAIEVQRVSFSTLDMFLDKILIIILRIYWQLLDEICKHFKHGHVI